jgi:DNA-binding NtrC family response regulator
MKARLDADSSAEPGDVREISTVKRPRWERRSASSAFEIVVLDGDGAGRRVIVSTEGPPLLVGGSALCKLRLTGRGVAARHCSFEVVDQRLKIVNLDASGTRVNGVIAGEAFLCGGEVVRIGDTVLTAHRAERHANAESGVVRRASSFGRIRGESEALRALFPLFGALAQNTCAVLIEGERGTGKRLLAEELHRQGIADGGPFVAFAQRAAPPEEIEVALFADGGLFESARGGTLYIAEVRDLSPAGQERLARAIARDAGVRVVMGTRGEAEGPLASELADGQLVRRVELPPLRRRDGDMLLLARHFWIELGGVGSPPDDFGARFEEHRFPGNVRELRMAVQDRLVHGADVDAVDLEPLCPGGVPDALARVIESDLPFLDARGTVLAEFEKRYVERAYRRFGGSMVRAAAASGIPYRYFRVLRARTKVP